MRATSSAAATTIDESVEARMRGSSLRCKRCSPRIVPRRRHGCRLACAEGSEAEARRPWPATPAAQLLCRFAAQHAVPPGADAGRELVIALDHVDRLA